MRDRYSYNSYQSGGGVMGQNPLGQDQPNPLPRSPQASPPNQAGKPLPPIMGSPLPDAGMKSGAMGSVSPDKPTFTPKQYEQEAAAKKNLSKGYNTGPAGGLMGAGVPQGSPAQGPGNPASQDPMSQGTQMLSQLWGGALGDVASGVPVGQEEPAQFAMGGPVANPGIAGLKNRMIQKRMGRGTAPGSSAAEVYRNTMQELQAGSMIEDKRKMGNMPNDPRDLGITLDLSEQKAGDDWNLDWPQAEPRGIHQALHSGTSFREAAERAAPPVPDRYANPPQWMRGGGGGPEEVAMSTERTPDRMMSVAPGTAGPSDGDYPYQDIISENAARTGLDENLVRAVVATESSFNPDAVSRSGYSGLMQMGKAAAQDVDMDWDQRFVPEVSVKGGTDYLKRLTDMFGGDLKSIIVAYNGGMGRVQRYGNDPTTWPRETQRDRDISDEAIGFLRKVTERYGGYGTSVAQFAHGGGIGGLRDQSQDIASKGRYGDSMLLHVRPDEVSGIESAIGRPLSINPETGNPEAWALTTSLLVGAALGAGIGAAGGFAATGDWKGAAAGAAVGGVGGAAGGALGGMGGGGAMAAMSGAASGAGVAQGIAAPIQQALTPAPEHKNVVDPFAASMPGGSSGGMQAARGGVTAAGLGMRSSGTPSVPGRLPGGSLNRRRRLLS